MNKEERTVRAISFLRKKRLLADAKRRFIIRFENGEEVDFVQLLIEYAEQEESVK